MKLFSKLNAVIVAAGMALGMTAGAASAQSTSVFLGFDAAEDSYTLFGGAVRALNGDINSDGVVLRFAAAYGQYEYDTTAVAGGKVDIDGSSANVMLGYQWVGGSTITALYLGVDYQNNDLSPADPSNSTSGDEFGGKASSRFSQQGHPCRAQA